MCSTSGQTFAEIAMNNKSLMSKVTKTKSNIQAAGSLGLQVGKKALI